MPPLFIVDSMHYPSIEMEIDKIFFPILSKFLKVLASFLNVSYKQLDFYISG